MIRQFINFYLAKNNIKYHLTYNYFDAILLLKTLISKAYTVYIIFVNHMAYQKL